MKQLSKKYSKLLDSDLIVDEYVKKLRDHYLEKIHGPKREKIRLLTELQKKDNAIKESKYISCDFFDALYNLYKLADNSENFEMTITDFINIKIKKLLLKIIKQIPTGKENNKEIINKKENMLKIIENDLIKQPLENSISHNTQIAINKSDFRKRIQEAFAIFRNIYPAFLENQEGNDIIATIDTILDSLPESYAYEKRPITPMYSIMNNNAVPTEIYKNHDNKKYNYQEELCCNIL